MATRGASGTGGVDRAPPTSRPRTGLLVIALVLAGAFLVVAVVFHAMSWGAAVPSQMFGPRGSATLAGIVYTVAGAVVAARRPSNPVGWLCLAVGVLTSVLGAAEAYSFWGLVIRDGRPPLAVWAGWLVEWAFIPWLVGMGLIAAVFPDGRWRSRGWKIATLVGCAGSVVAVVTTALGPSFTIFTGFDNPIGIDGGAGRVVVATGVGVSWSLGLLVIVGGTGSAVGRFRDSTGDEHQQMKWLAFASSLLLLGAVAYGLISIWHGALGISPGGYEWVEDITMAGVIALPIGIAIAVLKYRLYDIDRIISRSLGYAVLTVLLVGVYAGVVLGVGSALGRTDSPALIAFATLMVAALFRPARRRIQGAIDRRFHRRRYDAEVALAGFSTTLRGEGDLDELSRRMVEVVHETIDPASVVVWYRGGRPDRRG